VNRSKASSAARVVEMQAGVISDHADPALFSDSSISFNKCSSAGVLLAVASTTRSLTG
jgi:hypothetical protein